MSDDPPEDVPQPLTFEDFRRSFYYGSHSDMQFKFLARLDDDTAAGVLAELLHLTGEALDTGAWEPLRQAVFEAQVAAYAPTDPVVPEFDDAPFSPVGATLDSLPLALVGAGGIYERGQDPMGPDGPTQEEILPRIGEFLRGEATLTEIPLDTPTAELSCRHPGYDARTAQRDPNTVFPLDVLRDLASEGRVELAPVHYSFVGATSQVRLRERTAPE